MAYGTYATKVSSSSSNLKNKSDAIKGINFDSSWEGNAHDKQVSHRDDLTNSLEKVTNDMDTLATVLQELDQYDTIKGQVRMWEAEVNSIPSDEVEKRNNALSNLSQVRNRLTEKRELINGKLNSITTTYTSILNLIPATDVVATNNTFIKIFSSSSKISSNFDVAQYVTVTSPFTDNPNFDNMDAWVNNNPYSKAGLYGQCTWFAWGKFYEAYGYSPGFTGNGNQCAQQLVNTHPDKFEISKYPKTGAVFSYKGYPYGHTGFVTEVKDGMITIQDGNYDGVTNTFAVAKKDWGTRTMTVDQFINRYGGNVVFANPISTATV